MPPKAKFTKRQIIDAALEIAESEGMQSLTARSLGERLGSSSRPIFTVFKSMEEVQSCVIAAAKSLYNGYVERGLNEIPAFKGVGEAYIRFAREKPKLFNLLFMREQTSIPDSGTVLDCLDMNKEKILSSVENGYNLNRETAYKLYLHLWIYSHGVAVILATKVCSFTEAQISQMLTEVFSSMLKKIKTEGKL